MDYRADIFWEYLFNARIINGALITLGVAVLAQTLATLIGFIVALGLVAKLPYSIPAQLYLWVFRGVPPLVVLLMLYFGVPQLGLRLTVFYAGVIGLSLYASAYMAEIIRTGLQSIDQGQIEAAHSLGYSWFETMRSVVLPQAIRIILPPFGNEFTSMLRTTSLLSVISFEELLRVTTLAINQTFRPLELYSVAALYYLAMTSGWMLIQRQLEARASRGRRRNVSTLSSS